MKIVTISRQFGSGGRELGKRMADLLGFAYYDKEIITAIAEEGRLDEKYVARLLESQNQFSYPITTRRTLSYSPASWQSATNILILRRKIIKALAEKGNCVMIGQNADVILAGHGPFKIYVYADLPARIERCRKYGPSNEGLSDKELLKKIKQIDAQRSKSRQMDSNLKWGEKEAYHLCVNTTNVEIKRLAPHIAGYAKSMLGID